MKSDNRSGIVRRALGAVLRDLDPANQFHDEVRAAFGGRTGIEYLCDVRMIQECQGLPLGFEARDHCLRVHPWLDDLQCDLPLDRSYLVDEIRDAATSLAKFP